MLRHFVVRSLSYAFLSIILISEFLMVETQFKEDGYPRQRRSIKDDFLKDDKFAQSRTSANMRHKVFETSLAIFNLESSVKNMSSQMTTMEAEMEKISAQYLNIQETAIEQTAMMENLNGEVESLKRVLAGHGDLIGELEKLATADENLFVLSNNTCGGVLIGQSGSIQFSGSAAFNGNVNLPVSCLWTVRANNRRTIMITSIAYKNTGSLSQNKNGYAVEVLKQTDTNSTTLNTPTNQRIKMTRLQEGTRCVLTGPVIFIVFMLSKPSGIFASSLDYIQVHFEGLGKLTHKNTRFFHKSLPYTSAEGFSSNQIEAWQGNQDLDAKYSIDYASIVISNFSTKAYLDVNLENGACGDNETLFHVITGFQSVSEVTVVDCCKLSCIGANALVNHGDPFVVLISKKIEVPLQFNLSWEAEAPLPHSSGVETIAGHNSFYRCGGILGGNAGSISYKPRLSYRNMERCIWVIVPQPGPRPSISIEILSNGINTGSDALYMMELVHPNVTAFSNGDPKITPLRMYSSYVAYSREVYIVFYTDSTVTGQGFSLYWRSLGSLVKTDIEVSTNYKIFKSVTGTAISTQFRPARAKRFQQVFLLAPMADADDLNYGTEFRITQTQPSTEGCLHDDIGFYTTLNGVFRKENIQANCNERGQAVIHNRDGMAMIILNDTNTDSAPVAVNVSWSRPFGNPDDTNHTIYGENKCGGVVIGDKGILKFKDGEEYFNNERCIWLLQTPNHKSISLYLLRDGFEKCCDSIMVNTINPENGTLRNDTTFINRDNFTRTYDEAVLVITFESDYSTRGRGFVLKFEGKEDADESTEYVYYLQHLNDRIGKVAYPGETWGRLNSTTAKNEIFVVASSVDLDNDLKPQILTTNISLSSGVFMKANDSCAYESVTFYTSSTTNLRGWIPRKRLPEIEDTTSCGKEINVTSKADIVTTTNPSFIAIFRQIPSIVVEEDDLVEKISSGYVEFTVEQNKGPSAWTDFAQNMQSPWVIGSYCGGVIIGDSGVISYKEDGKYANNEHCVWLVRAPQAKKIEFRMERSGFELCCDLIHIYTISQDGSPIRALNMTQEHLKLGVVNRILDGPVVIVVFTSDHSLEGHGFRLTYETVVSATEPFPYNYYLEHKNSPSENEFIFNLDANELGIAAFSKEPDTLGDRGKLAKPQINVKSLRPQISKSCVSDEFTIYNVYGRDKGLEAEKSFSLLDHAGTIQISSLLSNHTCHPLDNGYFGICDTGVITECSDAPSHNVFNLNGTSFVAIYKSANVSSGDLQFRGVVMVSKIVGTGADTDDFVEYGSGEHNYEEE